MENPGPIQAIRDQDRNLKPPEALLRYQPADAAESDQRLPRLPPSAPAFRASSATLFYQPPSRPNSGAQGSLLPREISLGLPTPRHSRAPSPTELTGAREQTPLFTAMLCMATALWPAPVQRRCSGAPRSSPHNPPEEHELLRPWPHLASSQSQRSSAAAEFSFAPSIPPSLPQKPVTFPPSFPCLPQRGRCPLLQ